MLDRGVKASLPLPPGPKGHLLLGSGLDVVRGTLDFYLRNQAQYGPLWRFRVGPQHFTVLTHPEHYRKVLFEDLNHFPKGKAFEIARIYLGHGLVSSDGALWRRHRRTIQPVFHSKNILDLFPVMSEMVDAMLQRWQMHEEGGTLDLFVELKRLTMDVVTRALFGSDVDAQELERFVESDTAISYLMLKKYYSGICFPMWLPTPLNLRVRHHLRKIDRFVMRMVHQRRQQATSGDDFLGRLLEARDPESGQALSDKELRDQAVTFVFAGQDTTGNSLTWAFYLLSRNPEVYRKVQDELDVHLKAEEPTPDDLKALPYCRAFLLEAMRMYPAVWSMAREVVRPSEIGGYRVPKGDFVILVPYLSHKLEEFWSEPERCRPERFLENPKPNHEHAYYPFLAGARMCIGKDFALLEMLVSLAKILRAYRFEALDDPPVTEEGLITLRPEQGVPLRAWRRTLPLGSG